MNFEGIYPPVITPHHDNGEIDTDGFAEMIEFLIDSGVDGIIVGGTTGETYAQTIEERSQLMALANEVVNKRLPLVVGVGAIRTGIPCSRTRSMSTDSVSSSGPGRRAAN